MQRCLPLLSSAVPLTLFALTVWGSPVQAGSGSGGPSPTVLQVECDRGQTVSRALFWARFVHGPVVIEIDGMCSETVVVERPSTVLRGTDPTRDGIVSDGSSINTLMLRDVFEVAVENLSILAPEEPTTTALGVDDSFLIRIRQSRLEGAAIGAVFSNTNGGLEDTDLVGGNQALLITGSSAARCTRCTLSDGGLGGDALRVTEAARLTVEDSLLEAQRILRAVNGNVLFRDSTLEARLGPAGDGQALSIDLGSQVTMIGGTLDGPIFAGGKSLVQLTSMTQSVPPSATQSNRLTLDSVLRTSNAAIAGDLFLDHLSRAIVGDGTTIDGGLLCDPSAEAYCFGTVIAPISSCGGCPPP